MVHELHDAASHGDVQEVKRLLKTKLFDINEEKLFWWFYGGTPLTYAARNNHIEVAEILINHNADVNRGNPPPLHAAAENGHTEMVKLLLKHGAEANKKNKCGSTPLTYAAISNRIEVAEILINHNADVNRGNPLPLRVAAENGHAEMVKLLLKHGAEADKKDKLEWTPLECAALNNHTEVVEILVNYNADGHMEMVKYLLKHEADPNTISDDFRGFFFGATPLHAAAKRGHTSIVEVLLAHGADPNIKDRDGKTASDLIRDKHSKVYQVLFEHSKKDRALDKLKASIGDAVTEYLNVSSSRKPNGPVSLSCEVMPAQNNSKAAVVNLQISATGVLPTKDTSQVMSKLNTMHDDIKRLDIKMNNASLQDEPRDIPIQSAKHKRLLQNLVAFTTNLHCIDFICEYLLQSGIITISDKDVIKAEKTVREKASTLLTDYLLKKDETALDVFCNALREEGQEYLAEKIDCQ